MTSHPGFCDLCSERGTVEAALVAWKSPVFGKYESVDRCVDKDACRSRLADRGEEWPIVDPREPA